MAGVGGVDSAQIFQVGFDVGSKLDLVDVVLGKCLFWRQRQTGPHDIFMVDIWEVEH